VCKNLIFGSLLFFHIQLTQMKHVAAKFAYRLTIHIACVIYIYIYIYTVLL
jgi:hypothetical protein